MAGNPDPGNQYTVAMKTVGMRSAAASWLVAALAVAGLALTGMAMTRWAPDAGFRWADSDAVRQRAARDARRLGLEVSGEPKLQVSAGQRLLSNASEVRAVTESERGPKTRRQLWGRVPAVRTGARFSGAVNAAGRRGELLLEYDGDGRLIAAELDLDFSAEAPAPADRELADRLARRLLGAATAPPEVHQGPAGLELIYRPAPASSGPSPGAVGAEPEPGATASPIPGLRQPGPRSGRTAETPSGAVYVFLGDDGMWIAHRQSVPSRVVSEQSLNVLRWHPVQQVQVYTLVVAGILTLGLLLWRLARQRAGFSRAWVLLSLLLAGLFLPTLEHYTFRADPRLVVALWLYLILNQVGVLLFWTAGEAELREVRPGSVESWDRLIRWKPLAATGRHLVLGVAFGSIFAGFLAASGEAAAFLGGGYGTYLVILPDYWSLPTPLNWGLALAAQTALLVGFGGRLGGLLGAMAGAAVSTAGWSLVVPVAPLEDSLLFGFALAMVAGWMMWRHGLLVLATACVTAFSLPTAWVAWSAWPLLAPSALLSSFPAVLLPLGLVLAWRAPRYGDPQAVAPAYVSALEKQAKLRAELELLRGLQLSLLPPSNLAAAGDLDIAWRMIPADTVGGDFLDVVEDGDGRLWLAIADVAGHGISCSLLTAYTKAAVAEHAVAGAGPAEALTGIRRLFRRLRTRRTLVTLLLAVWDPGRRELSVVSAGHPPLLVCNRGKVREIGHCGQPLGVELAGNDGEERVPCDGAAVLVGYTDGVVEAMSPAGEPFTYDRWPAALPGLAEQPAAEILAELLGQVDAHCAGRAVGDDVTVAVVKICD